jgi:hypothetical protein
MDMARKPKPKQKAAKPAPRKKSAAPKRDKLAQSLADSRGVPASQRCASSATCTTRRSRRSACWRCIGPRQATDEQDATRARASREAFAFDHGLTIDNWRILLFRKNVLVMQPGNSAET